MTLTAPVSSNAVRNFLTVVRCQFQCLARALTVNATWPWGKDLAMAGELFLVLDGQFYQVAECLHFRVFHTRFGIEVCEQSAVNLDAASYRFFSSFILRVCFKRYPIQSKKKGMAGKRFQVNNYSGSQDFPMAIYNKCLLCFAESPDSHPMNRGKCCGPPARDKMPLRTRQWQK